MRGWRTAAGLLGAALALLLTAGAAQAQTTITLVSNTGQSQDSSSSFSVERAQPFTTGSHAAGYTLTSVTFPILNSPDSSPTVRIESSGTDNKPGGSLGALAWSQSGSTVTATASGAGIDLAADTTYFVVLFGSNDLTTSYTRTDSNSEDTGAATGWSIGDGSLWDSGGAVDWDRTSTTSWRIAIKGHANTAPTVANPISDQITPPGTAFSYAFPANTFNDADTGDTLTYSATKSDDTLLPSWLTFTAGTRTFSGTPQAADVGTLSVKVTASDGTASVSDTFDIVVAINSAPTVANAIPHQAATAGTAFSYQFPANTFADADTGDTLTYSATKGDDSALPSWLTFTPGTRTFSGTPQAADVGTLSVKVTASDGMASVSDTFDIVVLAAGAAPTPIWVEISSRPSHDANSDGTPETYTLGKIVQVQVTFSRAVTVTGTPRIKMKFDPNFGEKWLDYESGSGSRVLTFAYKVVWPNSSTQGIAVLQNTLELNGGTIRAGTANADLAHTGLGHDANHKVDAGTTAPPALVGATVNGRTLKMTFDEALAPGSTPAGSAFEVTATPTGGSPRTIAGTGTAGISGRTATVTLASAVAQGETVTLSYTKPLNSPLSGLNVNRTESFTGKPVTNDTGTAAPPRAPQPPANLAPQPPANLRPRFASGFGPLRLEPGVAMTPATLPAATGGDGELTYTLASSPAGLAGLDFDAATRRLSGTPEAAGDYGFTYTAHDADANREASDAAVLTFTVTVEDARTAAVRRSVRRVLAGVARRALTSALDNIGARFAASVPPGGLTLAGERVPFGAAAGAGVEEERGCAPGVPGRQGFGQAGERAGFGPDGEGCASVARSWSVEASELAYASAFSLTLGSGEGPGLASGPLWSVWGRGDLGSFSGRPGPGMSYDGELRTGWLGVDARSGPWVAGLAVSRGRGEADYSFAEGGVSGSGRLETGLTALYPYGRWTVSDGLEVRGVLGAGRGEARHWLDGEERETSDLSMRMGSAGLRHELPPLSGIGLAVRADASLARLETDEGPDHVDGLTADSWRVRAGLEASRRFALDGEEALEPFLEGAARRDGGDGLAGTGLEVAGGVRYTAPRLHVEARGRWLASHSEEGAEERGVSVTARLGPGAQGRGLSLTLSPRWGAGAGSAEALWGDELPRPVGSSGGGAASMDAGIGIGMLPHGLVTPFAETGLAGGDSRRLRLGARFDVPRLRLGAELAGERREGGAVGPEHAVRLDLGLRF